MGKPTIQKMNPTKLLDFVQSTLMVPLDRDDAQKLVSAKINGEAFLEGAGDRTIFTDAGISIGPGVNLSKLARTIVEAESEKGRFYLINTTQTEPIMPIIFCCVGLFFPSSP